MNYPKKNRFRSVPIAELCLYNIQREILVFKKSLCMSAKMPIQVYKPPAPPQEANTGDTGGGGRFSFFAIFSKFHLHKCKKTTPPPHPKPCPVIALALAPSPLV